MVRFLLGDALSATTYTIRVTVAGQVSNPLIVPVKTPVIDTVDLFDEFTLVCEGAADMCRADAWLSVVLHCRACNGCCGCVVVAVVHVTPGARRCCM